MKEKRVLGKTLAQLIKTNEKKKIKGLSFIKEKGDKKYTDNICQ